MPSSGGGAYAAEYQRFGLAALLQPRRGFRSPAQPEFNQLRSMPEHELGRQNLSDLAAACGKFLREASWTPRAWRASANRAF